MDPVSGLAQQSTSSPMAIRNLAKEILHGDGRSCDEFKGPGLGNMLALAKYGLLGLLKGRYGYYIRIHSCMSF